MLGTNLRWYSRCTKNYLGEMTNSKENPSMPRRSLHELSLQVLATTPYAVLVTEGLTDAQGAQINHWLPLSQIQIEESDPIEEGKVCKITIPQWLVEARGLTID